MDESFNTTLVQLKADPARAQVIELEREFQYHSGPIKRETPQSPDTPASSFQYHSGPIKSPLLDEYCRVFS